MERATTCKKKTPCIMVSVYLGQSFNRDNFPKSSPSPSVVTFPLPWTTTLTEPLSMMYQDLPGSPCLNTKIQKKKTYYLYAMSIVQWKIILHPICLYLICAYLPVLFIVRRKIISTSVSTDCRLYLPGCTASREDPAFDT